MKGHGVRTARALVHMAKQGNQIGLLRNLVKHMHSGVDVKQLRRAIFKDPNYFGILLIMVDRYWPLVIKLSTMPEETVLANTPALIPLYDLIKRCTMHVLIANAVSEHAGKVAILLIRHILIRHTSLV